MYSSSILNFFLILCSKSLIFSFLLPPTLTHAKKNIFCQEHTPVSLYRIKIHFFLVRGDDYFIFAFFLLLTKNSQTVTKYLSFLLPFSFFIRRSSLILLLMRSYMILLKLFSYPPITSLSTSLVHVTLKRSTPI